MSTELVLIKVQHDHSGVPDYHEWVTLGDRVRADSRGRPNPRMWSAHWTKWICNNSDCYAWALVADQFIQSALESLEG